MRRIFAFALVASAVTAGAASALVPIPAHAGPVDPGWELVYPGQPGYGGASQRAYIDETGQVVVAQAYQPPQTYYQPMPAQPPAYQPTPNYQPAPHHQPQPQRAYQQAPVYYQQSPAPQASVQPPPGYYQQQAPALQRSAYRQPAAVYYQQPPAAPPQPAPAYYQQQPPAQPLIAQPAPVSSWHSPPQPPPAYGQQIYASAQPQQERGVLASQPAPMGGYQPAPMPQQGGFQPAASYPQPAQPQQQAFGYPPPAYAPSNYGDMAHPTVDPIYDRTLVEYRGDAAPGTIIVDTPHYFLYLVLEGGKALRYGIGVGRPGFTWAGVKEVSAMREWPDWRPPAEMIERRPDLPRYVPGGPESPLGARALYLGSSLYRIHGSNEPWTIGTQVSSGCIRLRNADIVDLYARVKVGSKVIVI